MLREFWKVEQFLHRTLGFDGNDGHDDVDYQFCFKMDYRYNDGIQCAWAHWLVVNVLVMMTIIMSMTMMMMMVMVNCVGRLAGGQRVDDGDDDDPNVDDDDDGELRGQTGWWNPDQRPQTSFALHCQCNNRLNIDIIFIFIFIIVVIIVTLHCNDVKPWWTVIVGFTNT